MKKNIVFITLACLIILGVVVFVPDEGDIDGIKGLVAVGYPFKLPVLLAMLSTIQISLLHFAALSSLGHLAWALIETTNASISLLDAARLWIIFSPFWTTKKQCHWWVENASFLWAYFGLLVLMFQLFESPALQSTVLPGYAIDPSHSAVVLKNTSYLPFGPLVSFVDGQAVSLRQHSTSIAINGLADFSSRDLNIENEYAVLPLVDCGFVDCVADVNVYSDYNMRSIYRAPNDTSFFRRESLLKSCKS